MSLTASFTSATTMKSKKRPKRPAPFSLRLTNQERAKLVEEAAGVPLGSYIKAKITAGKPIRTRRTGLAVEDRKALAQALAFLGRSRLADTLSQIAHAVSTGSFPATPETEAELMAALNEVFTIRRLLMQALGLRMEEQPCS
jgi:hypothetical protein